MATKAKKGDKVNLKEWEGKDNLMIVDVSAHMRTNDAGDIPAKTAAEDLFFNRKKPRFQRKVLTTEINGEEMVVTSLYKLMNLFRQYKKLDATWVFAFDIGGGNFRKKIDKNYKANRVKMGSYYFDQVNTAYQILEKAGFTVLSKKGYEGDDCIEEAVRQNYEYYDNIGVLTNDHDLSFLVDEKVRWLNVRKTYSDIHIDNYFQQNKCPYNAILLKKAMVGDRSDEVSGIYRFGEKSFIKFLDKEGLHGKNVRGKELDILEGTTHLTEEQKEQAYHSWKLVKPVDLDIDASANDLVNTDILKEFFRVYEFKSLMGVFN